MCDRNLPDVEATANVWCDPCIAPLVKALNEGGIPTIASCCGHDHLTGNICLTDGRVLEILPNLDYLEPRVLPSVDKAKRRDALVERLENATRGMPPDVVVEAFDHFIAVAAPWGRNS